MSKLVSNTIETHNPGVDVLNITAAGLTVNGNPVEGGAGSVVIYDPDIVATDGNRYKTWTEVMAEVASLEIVDLRIHKAGAFQVADVPAGTYDLSNCRISPAPGTVLPVLSFTNPSELSGFPFSLNGVTIANNNTNGTPLHTVTSSLFLELVSGRLLTSATANSPVILYDTGTTLGIMVVDSLVDPFTKAGSQEPISVSAGVGISIAVLQVPTANFLTNTDIFSGDGDIDIDVYSSYPGGYTATHANLTNPPTVTMIADVRTDEIVQDTIKYDQTPGFKNADVRSSTNVVIASTNDGDVIDGVGLSSSIILLTNQTLPEENGLYLSSTAGGLTRLESYQTSDQIAGSLVHISEGTLGTGKLFKNTNTTAITVGADPITYVEFSLPSITLNSAVVVPSLSGANTPVSMRGILETSGSLEKQTSKFGINVTIGAGQVYLELECTNRVTSFSSVDDVIGIGTAFNGTAGVATPIRVLANVGTTNAALSFESIGTAADYEVTVDLKYTGG